MPEYFDVYTIDRKPLGKVCARGSKLDKNEYRLVVMAILINRDGEVLLTKRSRNKIAAGMWECTAGSVLAGEKSADAIVREIKEEIGITVQVGNELATYYIEDDAIFEIWAIPIEHAIDDLVLQKEEVDEAKYATLSEIEKMIDSGIATKSLSEVVRLAELGEIRVKYGRPPLV